MRKVEITINNKTTVISLNNWIQHPYTYILSNIKDFKYINKPFEDMKVRIRPTDIDLCVEKKGCFIFGEFKQKDKDEEIGQKILFKQLQRLNKQFKENYKYKIECLVIWTEKEDGLYKKPIKYRRYKCDGQVIDVETDVIDSLNLYFIKWYETVNKYYKE